MAAVVGAMADVVNDHLVLSNLIYDQIVANWQSPEARFAGYSPRWGVSAIRTAACSIRVARRAAASGCRRRCRKDVVEVGERAAFKAKFHALR
jgi:hypothetical protein